MSSSLPEPIRLLPRTQAAAFGPRPVDQRIGDAERSAVCEELSRQYAAGRLTDDELELRVGAAMSARTRGDLHPLLVDLPPDAPPPVPIGPPRPAAPIWSALDVLALITLVGTVAVASLGALGVTAAGSSRFIWAFVLTAITAGLGGMSLVQVLHRMHHSVIERAEQRIRQPRTGQDG